MNMKEQKQKKGKKNGKEMKLIKPKSFTEQLIGALLIFMVLSYLYSFISERKATPVVSLSTFATMVSSREFTSITVDGDSLTGEKMDKDRFRQDLGNVIEAYEQVAQRIGVPL